MANYEQLIPLRIGPDQEKVSLTSANYRLTTKSDGRKLAAVVQVGREEMIFPAEITDDLSGDTLDLKRGVLTTVDSF